MIHITCWQCGKPFRMEDNAAGRTFSCTACSKQFVVPAQVVRDTTEPTVTHAPGQPPALPEAYLREARSTTSIVQRAASAKRHGRGESDPPPPPLPASADSPSTTSPLPADGARPAPPPVHAELESLAIASLVVGVTGLVTCPLVGIVAIPLGVNARQKIRRSDGQLDGDSYALAGMILGGISLLVSAVGMVLFAVVVSAGR